MRGASLLMTTTITHVLGAEGVSGGLWGVFVGGIRNGGDERCNVSQTIEMLIAYGMQLKCNII